MLSHGCGESNPVAPPVIGTPRTFSDHVEIDVVYPSAGDGARLAGTVYLPPGPGPFPAIIHHHGSDRWSRSAWNPFVELWVDNGVAVLSYDKRGVGKSEGRCCPWKDPGYFQLLASDLIGGVRALQRLPEIDPQRIGLYGFSQGGWVVPTAAAMAPDEVAFIHLGSGPAVSLGEELLYSELTGDDDCVPSGLSEQFIEGELDRAGPTGFDPLPFLERVAVPGLWQYCADDTSIPVQRSIANLTRIRDAGGKDFTIELYPNCNHLFIRGGAMCEQSDRPRVDWWTSAIRWLDRVVD